MEIIKKNMEINGTTFCTAQLDSAFNTFSAHVIRHFGRLVNSCVVSIDIFVFRREFAQWLPKCWRFWNWVSVHDVFAELARDFSRLKGVLFASNVTASSPS